MDCQRFTEEPQERLVQGGYDRTTATKTITRGEHKGKWRLMWNPAQGGVWAREPKTTKYKVVSGTTNSNGTDLEYLKPDGTTGWIHYQHSPQGVFDKHGFIRKTAKIDVTEEF